MTHQTVLLTNPGSDLYGSDRVLLETVSALCSRGNRVVVTVPSPGPLVAEIIERGGTVMICRTPVVTRSMSRPRGLLRLFVDAVRSLRPSLALIRAVDPDLILVNTITTPLWLVLAKLGRRRSVCHVHEAEASAPRILRRAIGLPLLLTDRVIANSEFSRGVLGEVLPSLMKRTVVIHNFVPGPMQVVAPRQDLAGGCRILFVGRLSRRKGPEVAIAALARLRVRGIDATIDLVGATVPGSEWFQHEVDAQVKELDLADVVKFRGFQTDIWPYVAAADIVVVPSTLEESFGNTAVEALLGARPLVVSNIGALQEAISGFSAARAVVPGDAESLANAIEEITASWQDWRRAALCDAQAAARRYSSQEYGQRVIEVIDSMRLEGHETRQRSPLHSSGLGKRATQGPRGGV